MDERWRLLDQLFRRAMVCRLCFQEGLVSSTVIDIAQPRWVGPRYFEARPRILVVLLNPGSGEGYDETLISAYLDDLREYQQGKMGLAELFTRQRADMSNWGRPPGRFLSFFTQGLGLNLDEIAFVNMAWCASASNRYPGRMLTNCFNKHTVDLMRILKPHLVFLSGKRVHTFGAEVRKLLGRDTRVVPLPHYAHRKGRQWEAEELERIRSSEW